MPHAKYMESLIGQNGKVHSRLRHAVLRLAHDLVPSYCVWAQINQPNYQMYHCSSKEQVSQVSSTILLCACAVHEPSMNHISLKNRPRFYVSYHR